MDHWASWFVPEGSVDCGQTSRRVKDIAEEHVSCATSCDFTSETNKPSGNLARDA